MHWVAGALNKTYDIIKWHAQNLAAIYFLEDVTGTQPPISLSHISQMNGHS
jgi:hypothetical protein